MIDHSAALTRPVSGWINDYCLDLMATSPSSDASDKAKDSSSKKVAKAARAGGRTPTGQRTSLAFPAATAAVCVLGLALVTYGFFQQQDRAEAVPRLGDHWHSAYGIYLCDSFAPQLADAKGDAVGVHTHNDGLIHIHPFSSIATGDDARLEDFFTEVDLKVKDDSIEMPNGETYTNGDDCNGEPGEVKLAVWDQAADAEPSEILTENHDSARLAKNGQAYVLAFVPEGTEIPKPPTVGGLSSVDNTIDFDQGVSTPIEVEGESDGTESDDTESGDVIVEDSGDGDADSSGDDEDSSDG